MNWVRDFDEYHDTGMKDCPACMVPPEACQCGGLVHNQLENEDLQEYQRMCDRCNGNIILVYENSHAS